MDTTDVTTNPSNFDILDLLSGQEYPTKEVVLYTDAKSAQELKKDPGNDGLKQKLHDSALVFNLQGVEPGTVADIYADETKNDNEHVNELIAKSIVSVKTGAGATDPAVWDATRVDAVRRKLNLSEVAKLVEAVTEVNFDAALFDNAVDAGFSS